MLRNHEEGLGRAPRSTSRAATFPLVASLFLVAACDLESPEPRDTAVDTPTTTPTVTQRAAPVRTESTPPPSEPAPDTTPDPAERYVTFEEADVAFHSGSYGEAADLFAAYSERKPDNPWGPYMLGLAAWRDGDHDRAETALRRTLEIDGTHSKGMLNLARVLLDKGKTADALNVALALVALKPESGEGWRVLGNAYAEGGMPEAATDAYRKAIVLDSDDAWTMNNLGLLRIQKGEYREALGPLARATELRPEQATFQNNFGVALERSGYEAEAADAFRAALEANPDHGKARVSLDRVVERRPGDGPAETVELSTLTSTFEEEVTRWKTEGGTEEADRTTEDEEPESTPSDTTGDD